MNNIVIFDSADAAHAISDNVYLEFQKTLDLALGTLSQKSRRQYRSTFNLWKNYCTARGNSIVQLDPSSIQEFITVDWHSGQSWSNSTRKNRLSHMRKFLSALYAAQPDNPLFARWHEQATKFLSNKNLGGETNVRSGVALKPTEVYQVLASFDTSTNKGLRDRAILILLFFYAMRRFEVAKMKWDDINFETGIIRVQGKGREGSNEYDEIPTINEDGLQMLHDWKACCPDREYIFPTINKSDKLGADNPLNERSINKIIDTIGDSFKSHDGRRTIITHMINQGAKLQDVQRFARHSHASTTLRYAKSKQAQELGEELKKFSF
jgi:integrase